jgi:phage-related protein
VIRQLLYVKWLDAQSHGDGWEDINDVKAEAPVAYTVGWLVDETDKAMALVQTISTDEDGTEIINRQVLPKGMILEKRELKVGEAA